MNDPRIEKLERRVHELEDKIQELESGAGSGSRDAYPAILGGLPKELYSDTPRGSFERTHTKSNWTKLGRQNSSPGLN